MDNNPTIPAAPQPAPVLTTDASVPAVQPQTMVASNPSGGSKKALVIVIVIVLLIAAIAGGAYVYMTYLAPKPASVTEKQTSNIEQAQQNFEDLNTELRAVDGGGAVEGDFVEVDQDLQAL